MAASLDAWRDEARPPRQIQVEVQESFQLLCSVTMVQNPDTQDLVAEEAPLEPAAPITSRFLFVDVAAQRAKQLRRGALPRLDRHSPGQGPHKLERVAMEEVRGGLIYYTLPTAEEFGRGAKR